MNFVNIHLSREFPIHPLCEGRAPHQPKRRQWKRFSHRQPNPTNIPVPLILKQTRINLGLRDTAVPQIVTHHLERRSGQHSFSSLAPVSLNTREVKGSSPLLSTPSVISCPQLQLQPSEKCQCTNGGQIATRNPQNSSIYNSPGSSG